MHIGDQEWIALSAICRHLGRSLYTGYRWIRSGALQAVRMPTRHYADERPRKTARARWYVHVDEWKRFLRLLRAGTYT